MCSTLIPHLGFSACIMMFSCSRGGVPVCDVHICVGPVNSCFPDSYSYKKRERTYSADSRISNLSDVDEIPIAGALRSRKNEGLRSIGRDTAMQRCPSPIKASTHIDVAAVRCFAPRKWEPHVDISVFSCNFVPGSQLFFVRMDSAVR